MKKAHAAQGENIMIEFYDNHIHREYGPSDSPSVFFDKARSAGCIGGNVLSLGPKSTYSKGFPWKERVDDILDFCSGLEGFSPFFWIDPTEEDAEEQADYAAAAGIRGFKVLCSRYAPCDGMKTYERIAGHGLPVLFHSGVLWDGHVSSAYNRPMAFEGLMEVKNFRFALAHVSWPWCDECIAMFGKIRSAQRAAAGSGENCNAQMFIDTTPGTPYAYREGVFEKAYLIDYDLKERLVFGTDGICNRFDAVWAQRWLNWDLKIMRKIRASADDKLPFPCDLPDAEELFRKETQDNYLAFLTGKN